MLVLASVLVTGCDHGYCDASGQAIDIFGLPEVDEGYTFDLEFEGRQVSLHCVPRDDHFHVCETESGPWRVIAAVGPYPWPTVTLPIPANTVAPVTVGIAYKTDYQSFVPKGEIKVVVTAAEYSAEHTFIAETVGPEDCRGGLEIWDLAPGP